MSETNNTVELSEAVLDLVGPAALAVANRKAVAVRLAEITAYNADLRAKLDVERQKLVETVKSVLARLGFESRAPGCDSHWLPCWELDGVLVRAGSDILTVYRWSDDAEEFVETYVHFSTAVVRDLCAAIQEHVNAASVVLEEKEKKVLDVVGGLQAALCELGVEF